MERYCSRARNLLVSFTLAALGTAALVAGSAGAASANKPPASPPPITTVVTLDPARAELPESMTADEHGNLYFSLINNTVHRIAPDHSVTQIATVPVPAPGLLTGIKVGPDGRVYVASASFTSSPDAAFIWRISLDTGAVEQFAALDATGFPNDLAFEDDGTLFVTDPFLARLWKIDPAGNPSVFLDDPLFAGDPVNPAFAGQPFGIDGIAFGENEHTLIVSTLDFGRIMTLDLDGKDHQGPELSVLVEDPALKGIDGIAIDHRGTIYCAVNTQDRIATVDKHGTIEVLTEGPPLDGTSSFAFGTGHDDKKTLYVANFAIGRFLAGQPAHPSIVSLPVQVGGRPLIP
jgi:sugar lactone lactonase YvrE